MKSTDAFKKVIENHLTKLGSENENISLLLKKENKNIDDCISYILETVQKSKVNGFADEEIYGMALHYYQEDSIVVDSKKFEGRVVVNHTIELSKEEKEAQKEKSLKDTIALQKARFLKKKSEKPKVKIENPKAKIETSQMSLFQ